VSTATLTTAAETKARALAERLEEAGYTCRFSIETSAPELYSDGEVMLPGKVLVHVHADSPREYDNDYSFGFVTWLPAKGHRSSTRFVDARTYRPFGRPYSKKLTRQGLIWAISSEVDMARYRAAREREEGK
jgi:hypothetical protein